MPTQNTFPVFADQGGLIMHTFAIDGSEVTTSAAATGLDGRGQMLATIKDDGANLQTILFRSAMKAAYVFVQPLTANGAANITMTTSGTKITGFTLTGVERDDNTQALADQDFNVHVIEYTTTQYVN